MRFHCSGWRDKGKLCGGNLSFHSYGILCARLLWLWFFFVCLCSRLRNAEYRELLEQNDATDDSDHHRNIQLQNQRQRRIRQENVLEAQIQSGDTLQAIALRYNCTVSRIRFLLRRSRCKQTEKKIKTQCWFNNMQLNKQ